MAQPQLEDGYIRIATELFTALKRLDLQGSEWQVIIAVMSKTYGWNKPRDQISLSQFEKETGMTRTRIIRAIKNLVRYNVLGSITGDTSNSSTYWIIKDYDKWNTSYSIIRDTTIPSIIPDTRPSIIRDQKLVSHVIHTINTTKDILYTAHPDAPKKPSKSKTVFTKPSLEHIRAYCAERNNNIDPDQFFDRMETCGWVYGKNKHPVRDWKACIRTWERYSNGGADAVTDDPMAKYQQLGVT